MPPDRPLRLYAPLGALLAALAILTWSAIFAEAGVAAAPGPRGPSAVGHAVVGSAPARTSDWAFTLSEKLPSGEVECEISLRPTAVALPDPELVGTLAHETFHCLVNQIAGFDAKPPAWISEGLPEWVGCEIGREAG